mmetsp:Transcript_53883/g.174068  ORF Transcript_53883/g.174068 Transcript_53883/m.174068 type:complete len:115 (-) Transcript_53883:16-360(-)
MPDQNEFVQALCPQCRDGYDEKEMLCDSLAVLVFRPLAATRTNNGEKYLDAKSRHEARAQCGDAQTAVETRTALMPCLKSLRDCDRCDQPGATRRSTVEGTLKTLSPHSSTVLC